MRAVPLLAALGALALSAHAASTLNFLDKQGRSCRMYKEDQNVLSSCDVSLTTGTSIGSNLLDIQENARQIGANRLHTDTRVNQTIADLEAFRQATQASLANLTTLIADLADDHEALARRVTHMGGNHTADLAALNRTHHLAVAAQATRDRLQDEARQDDYDYLHDAIVNVSKMEGPKGEVGATGAKGATGAMGATGAKGEAGDKGQKGQRGYKGQQGFKGFKGHKGVQGDAAPIIKRSCLDWQAAGETQSKVYSIMPDGHNAVDVWCFMDSSVDNGGYDIKPVVAGDRTCKRTDKNSCPKGMNIWVPRTEAHWRAVQAKFGGYGTNSALMHVAGIYGIADGCGGCGQNDAFNSGSAQGNHWKAVDAGTWWLRDDSYAEPSGDYTANCWLYIFDKDVDTDGGIRFNDHMCHYCFTNYLCSTNAKL